MSADLDAEAARRIAACAGDAALALRSALAEQREALGAAWFRDGATLSEACRRKTAFLERCARSGGRTALEDAARDFERLASVRFAGANVARALRSYMDCETSAEDELGNGVAVAMLRQLGEAAPDAAPPTSDGLAAFAEAFARVVEDAERAREARGMGGQQVPYMDDFGHVTPATAHELRWWAKRAREALDGRP